MSVSPPLINSTKPARPTSHANLRRPTAESAIDEALVRRVLAGDEAAFVMIMDRYYTNIFNVTLGYLRNHADAEEVTQDTFIHAHRALGRFRGDCSLATWLYRIAVNLSRNRYGYFFRRRRQDTLSFESPFGEGRSMTLAELMADDVRNPAQAMAASEFFRLVDTCMKQLETPHRDILTLRNVLDRSYGEIAATLGLNVGTVKSRIARAREKLRTLVTEACPEFDPGTAFSEWFLPARAAYGAVAVAS